MRLLPGQHAGIVHPYFDFPSGFPRPHSFWRRWVRSGVCPGDAPACGHAHRESALGRIRPAGHLRQLRRRGNILLRAHWTGYEPQAMIVAMIKSLIVASPSVSTAISARKSLARSQGRVPSFNSPSRRATPYPPVLFVTISFQAIYNYSLCKDVNTLDLRNSGAKHPHHTWSHPCAEPNNYFTSSVKGRGSSC